MSKNILITGAAGFIGSHLCDHFLMHNYNVRGVDNFITGHKKNIQHLIGHKNFEFIEGDIRDELFCDKICLNIDYVSHQAALGSVPRSIKDPITTNHINVQGFLNLINSCKKNAIKKFIYASSSSVYGDSKKLPKIENETGEVLSPYALTKKINEEYSVLFSNIYGLKTVGLRYFNVFGPKQDPDGPYAAVIPKFINSFINGISPVINGDGTFSRDFTYVDNVAIFNRLAIESRLDTLFNVFNVAFGSRITLNEMALTIKNYISLKNPEIRNIEIIYGNERVGDISHSCASIEKAKKLLNYKPDINFKDGIIKTIDWFWNNNSKK